MTSGYYKQPYALLFQNRSYNNSDTHISFAYCLFFRDYSLFICLITRQGFPTATQLAGME